MYAPSVVSSRSFALSSLKIVCAESQWSSSARYDELVRSEWEAIVRESTAHIWDGRYYRVQNPDAFARDSALFPICLGTIAYRYIATFPRLFDEHAGLALEPLNHLSTIALIRTADNRYVFGVRNRTGLLELIGGGAQCDELEIHSGADLEKNLYKEAFEEAGLNEADFNDLAGAGVVTSSTSNILIVAHAKLNLDSDEVRRKFELRSEDEMNRLVFIPSENVRSLLKGMHDYRNLISLLEW